MDLWVRGNANVFACHAVIPSTTHLPTCAKSNPTLLHEANKAATDPQELEEAGFEALEPFRVQGFAGSSGSREISERSCVQGFLLGLL